MTTKDRSSRLLNALRSPMSQWLGFSFLYDKRRFTIVRIEGEHVKLVHQQGGAFVLRRISE